MAGEHANAAKCRTALTEKFGSRAEHISILNGNEVHVKIAKEDILDFCRYVHRELQAGLCTMVCSDEREKLSNGFVIRHVFAKENGEDVFIVLAAVIPPSGSGPPSYPSIALDIPPAVLYEREIKDMFGLVAAGNPDARPLVLHEYWPEHVHPLRKDFDIKTKVPRFQDRQYQFTKVEGEGVCEIPVGPVHAGIIEPGHFRFSVLGENILNLEARLFYTHKGVEKLAEGMTLDQALLLSERIAGDEAVANSTAYCQALEKIARMQLPKRALQIRTVCAEMERIYSHLGTLAGMSTDVGFAYGSARLNILKERMMQLNSLVSGHRLLFGINRIGGVGVDLSDKIPAVINTTQTVLDDFERVISMLRSKSSFIDRLKGTGMVTRKVANDLGLVGVAARAAGLDRDARRDHPYAAYSALSVDAHHDTPQHMMEHEVGLIKMQGDALSRFNVRVEEVADSVRMIDELISNLSDDRALIADVSGRLEPWGHALGYAESHRGLTVHWAMAGENGDSLFRYKVRTASFVNWPAIEQAVLKDIVPDFPLVNKSLDFSYSGNDM